MAGSKIQIMLALNDPRSGNPCGRAAGLDVPAPHGDIALSLEANDTVGPVCRYDNGQRRLMLGRHTYPVLAHQTWVGNWCWDSFLLDAPTAVALLNEARASNWWSLNSGFQALWERWESDQPFDVGFLLRELGVRPAAVQ